MGYRFFIKDFQIFGDDSYPKNLIKLLDALGVDTDSESFKYEIKDKEINQFLDAIVLDVKNEIKRNNQTGYEGYKRFNKFIDSIMFLPDFGSIAWKSIGFLDNNIEFSIFNLYNKIRDDIKMTRIGYKIKDGHSIIIERRPNSKYDG